MIIQIGDHRRLRSYTHGWVIEIRKRVKQKQGGEVIRWIEDPAGPYPANLAHGLQSCLLRILEEGGDCDVGGLPERIEAAYKTLRKYLEMARKAA